MKNSIQEALQVIRGNQQINELKQGLRMTHAEIMADRKEDSAKRAAEKAGKKFIPKEKLIPSALYDLDYQIIVSMESITNIAKEDSNFSTDVKKVEKEMNNLSADLSKLKKKMLKQNYKKGKK